jgi:hypothetical protein
MRFRGSAVGVLLLALVLLMTAAPVVATAQTEENQFAHWLFTSVKVGSAIGKWPVLGDYQVRFRDDLRELDQWFVDGALTYSPSANWEITPDFRVAVKPSRLEYRPGAGVIVKVLPRPWQFALQHKYQLDIYSTGGADHGFRQALFINRLVSSKVIASVLGGWFYRWSDEFSGIQFVRAGPNIAYVIDPLHAINLGYFLG